MGSAVAGPPSSPSPAIRLLVVEDDADLSARLVRLLSGESYDVEVAIGARRNGMATPTLILSTLGSPADRVMALGAGADDYLARPLDDEELLARLRALRLRHLDAARRLRVPGGALEVHTRQVTLTGRVLVRLSARECALTTLAGHPSTVFSRDELRTLAFDEAGAEIVDTYVHYLRRKRLAR